ncbi:apolipoprotein A-I-like [Polypterus senegalus]|nr:apolipoprotein A-I-like [Polypterus senegalus]
MKSTTVALALLFVAGCHANFLWQSDQPPSQLDDLKTSLITYINQVQASTKVAIDQINNQDLAKQLNLPITEGLEQLTKYVQLGASHLEPYTDTANKHLQEGKKLLVETQSKLAPVTQQMREKIQLQIDEYRTKLSPLADDLKEKAKENTQALRDKLQPYAKELLEKLNKNVEELRTQLAPLTKEMRRKATQQLKTVRKNTAPYTDEVTKKVSEAVEELQKKIAPLGKNFEEKLSPYIEEIKKNILSAWDSVREMFN